MSKEQADNVILLAEHKRMHDLLTQLLDHWDDGESFYVMSHTYAPRIRELLDEVKARK